MELAFELSTETAERVEKLPLQVAMLQVAAARTRFLCWILFN